LVNRLADSIGTGTKDQNFDALVRISPSDFQLFNRLMAVQSEEIAVAFCSRRFLLYLPLKASFFQDSDLAEYEMKSLNHFPKDNVDCWYQMNMIRLKPISFCIT
jgi:hypothetical protein